MTLMKEEVCNYNSRISVKCLERRYPKINVQKDIVDWMNKEYDFRIKVPNTEHFEPLTAQHLSDKRFWASNQMYVMGFYPRIVEVTGNSGVCYGMGRQFFSDKREIEKDMTSFLGPIISVQGIIDHMPSTMAQWNRTKRGIVLLNEPGHFKFAIQHHPEVIVTPFAIEYHKGIFDGVADMCGLVGFETQLVRTDDENRYLEFEGRYEFQRLPARVFNQLEKQIPHIARILEVDRETTINSREASIREKVQKEKEEWAKNELKKFVPVMVVENVIDRRLKQERVSYEQSLSILFTDIRDFTALTEKADKKTLIDVLNQYFDAMDPSVENHRGWVDKYLGDAMMVLYQNAYDSVSSAIDMRFALREFNRELEAQNLPHLSSLRTGIGIATGNVLIGNIGSKRRMDVSVVDDTVNTASRLEGLTKEYGVSIIVDEQTYRDIERQGMIAPHFPAKPIAPVEKDLEKMLGDGKIFAREIDLARPKGKENAIRIYEIMNSISPDILLLKVLSDEVYREALKLSHCEGTDLKKIQMALEKSTHLFERIDSFFKGRNQPDGDYICRQKIEENLEFLRRIKTEPAFFSNPDWFVRSFNGK